MELILASIKPCILYLTVFVAVPSAHNITVNVFLILDVLFEEDESVMPLMSAFKVWSKLEHTVTDESLFRNIYTLLVVQVILEISSLNEFVLLT